ncbi:hypothetical protein N0V90_010016 [Kalmusia sp. IMI 367209]|nr:hypothetical protein N0V90_010016 [Kalmusia sp. IMI 367209]
MVDSVDGKRWYLAISMVDASEDTWDLHTHCDLDNTKDGGLSVWLPTIDGKPLKKWNGGTAKEGDWTPSTHTTPLVSTEETLKARCHCGGVEFYISRPRGSEAHSGLPENMTPKDKTKWYALNDVCTSCRLLSGCAIVSWAFPEISHITLPDGSPYRPLFGTLKLYKSSPEVTRTFCGTCGALVTYSCDDRPNHVDVGVGLLDAETGVRAEEWLEWRTHRLAYEEDCVWKKVLQGIKSGMQDHGKNIT